MSSSQEFSEAMMFPGWRMAKAPEKSNFSQTCNLLSQYLKEKGSFGDLGLGMTCNPEGKGRFETFRPAQETMDLLPKLKISDEVSESNEGVADRNHVTRNAKSMNMFPQFSNFAPSVSMQDVRKTGDLRTATEPETAQMTIFYAGRVLVFDSFPSEKAKELMLLASMGSSQNSGNGNFPQQKPNPISSSGNGSLPQHNPNLTSSSTHNPPQESIRRPPQAVVSDLPIARKASLHRFLEKRKDRINAKAPYQLTPASSAPTESKSWLGLAPQAT
ncbi:protein TIFY 10A-like [Tasmannia lanceolata]|uniref:protein TIFY 10A-like n=1 Tax=Tasmannia lanceolata TaxID=3420 RepID=UPI004062C13B